MAKIKLIHRRKIEKQRLYNLAVSGDESYVANDIVVHNCKSFIVPNLKGKENPELTKGGFTPSRSSLEKYITLAEMPADGLAVESIQISKKVCSTLEDAKRIALEWRIDTTNIEETESGYKFKAKDPFLFLEGTLKTVEPMEGVILWIGLLKPEMMVALNPKVETPPII